MAFHRSKDKLLASHNKLDSSTDTLDHSTLSNTSKTISKSHNCLTIKTPNLRDLVVNQQVCMDLCVPFWRCRPLHKTTSLPPQSSRSTLDSKSTLNSEGSSKGRSNDSNSNAGSKMSSNSGIELSSKYTKSSAKSGNKSSNFSRSSSNSKTRVRVSHDSLVPASKDDLFCVKTPYPVRVHSDAMTLNSLDSSLTSDLGSASRSFSKSLDTSRSFDADIISLDTKSCSEYSKDQSKDVSELSADTSFEYHNYLGKITARHFMTLDEHINRALGVSYSMSSPRGLCG